MRLALRDLFWIVLIVALGIAWGLEQVQVARALASGKRTQDAFFSKYRVSESPYGRKDVQEVLQNLSNAELTAYIENADSETEESYWLEMSRRRMSKELRAIYNEAKNQPSSDPNEELYAPGRHWDNGRLLTALRRAEGKPDPILIEIHSLGKDPQGNRLPFPLIIPKVTNVDAEREPCYLTQGCDDRGTRHDRWRVHLTNSRGELMQDVNCWPGMGGIGSFGMLPYGNKVHWVYRINPLDYVRSPPSGKYSLVLVHAEEPIASDRNMTGRIVWQSKPVPVIVENLSLSSKWVSARLPFAILVATLIVGCVAVVRRYFWPSVRPLLNRRDWFALTIVALLAAGWCGGVFLMKLHLEKSEIDFQGSWTMRLAE